MTEPGMPSDALDPAVNSVQDDQTDETPVPWDPDAQFPEEVDQED
jgi:hypothetical protein